MLCLNAAEPESHELNENISCQTISYNTSAEISSTFNKTKSSQAHQTILSAISTCQSSTHIQLRPTSAVATATPAPQPPRSPVVYCRPIAQRALAIT